MDSKKRKIIGILIITLIFGVLSILSAISMFDGLDEKDKLEKTSYMLLLEKELGIEFKSDNDFENFTLVDYEMTIIPQAYKYYIKPCFDFVVESDGVVITSRTSKEFEQSNLKIGDKIVKIDDEVLSGKTYFEIINLILSNKEVTKKFTLINESEVLYQYSYSTSYISYNEDENTLSVYNLDEVTTRAIHEEVKAHPDLTLDLSQATVTTEEGLINFLSLFSLEDAPLFTKGDTSVIGKRNRKITNLKIEVKDNQDLGILFALTCVKRLNSNIIIDKANLNTTQFYAEKTLTSSTYTIFIKNVLLKAVSANNNGGLYT